MHKYVYNVFETRKAWNGWFGKKWKFGSKKKKKGKENTVKNVLNGYMVMVKILQFYKIFLHFFCISVF